MLVHVVQDYEVREFDGSTIVDADFWKDVLSRSPVNVSGGRIAQTTSAFYQANRWIVSFDCGDVCTIRIVMPSTWTDEQFRAYTQPLLELCAANETLQARL